MPAIARRTLAGLLCLLACSAWCATPAQDCRLDLDELPGFLLANDAGGPDLHERLGAAHFEAALATARRAADAVQTDADCLPVLRAYLDAWRHAHLQVGAIVASPSTGTPPSAASADERMPTLRVLSARTLLITLRSFALGMREPLARLLAARRRDLESHPDWIIDVRDNTGGADSSYAPLMPWLVANGSVSVGVDVRVTPANIAAWANACAMLAPGHADCPGIAAPIVERMQAARPGEDIPLHPGHQVAYDAPAAPPGQRPERVALLVDGGCASSCEQFALEARQGFGVKLVGRHTWGGLDYSNLSPHDLPSGKRRLAYATTRSLRIPDQPVDGIGVLPDLYLPRGDDANAARDEVERTRRWLEGGTLAPLH